MHTKPQKSLESVSCAADHIRLLHRTHVCTWCIYCTKARSQPGPSRSTLILIMPRAFDALDAPAE
jgi:hypothetical protein